MATSMQGKTSATQAAQILREIFSNMEHGFQIRLWDGTEVPLGRQIHPVTVVFPSVKSFKRVLLNPHVAEFAEAYCDGDIDFEGDLFDVMRVADSMEDVDLSFWGKMKIALQVKRLSD